MLGQLFEPTIKHHKESNMPKIAKPLSAIEIKRLIAPKLYPVGTVPGLCLDVKITAAGGTAASWILRTTIGNRRVDMGLGGYPGVTLQAAWEAARELKRQIRTGIDPTADRKARQSIVEWTFRRCATAYIEGHRAEWKNAKHVDQWTNTLITYVYPVFGDKHVRAIHVADVLNAIEPQWNTKNETMNRVRNRIELILAWAAARGYRSKENPAAWKGNLDQTLPKPSKVKNEQHHPAVQIDEAHTFMLAVQDLEGTAARCLEFVALTSCRSGEARLATWNEFGLKDGLWTVPGERMKSGRPQRVPLSRQVHALLAALPHFEGTDLVFPGRDGQKPLSDMSLTQIMRRMSFKDTDGRQAVPHGIRSTFMDWATERTAYPVHVTEMVLAHSVGNATREAYRRGDLFEKRTHLMSDWASFLTTPPAEGNVVMLRVA
jgi:integrase